MLTLNTVWVAKLRLGVNNVYVKQTHYGNTDKSANRIWLDFSDLILLLGQA